MNLEPDQEDILAGENGPALANALKTLVQYGTALGAKKLIPIKSSHLVGTFGVGSYKSYYHILNQLVNEKVFCKAPATLNPRPGHKLNLINRIAFSKQNQLERLLSDIGAILNYSCVCYDGANVPNFGDRISWAESSAVQHANSVLGARTNRNSLLIDLCSAVTGYAPEFGYMLDKNRRGQILVKLNITKIKNIVPFWRSQFQDRHHDFFKTDAKGKVLVFPAAIGSTFTGMVLLELIANKSAPAAMIVQSADSLLVSGPVLGDTWFDLSFPIVEYANSDIYNHISNDDKVTVNGTSGDIMIQTKGAAVSG